MTDLSSSDGSEIVGQAPRISVTTSSSCWAVMVCLALVDGVFFFLFYFPLALAGDFLFFFAV